MRSPELRYKSQWANLKLVLPMIAKPLQALALALVLPATVALAQTDLPDAPGATNAPKAAPVPTGPTIVIDTTMGRLTCKTFDKQAPKAVANFIGLAEGTKDWSLDEGKTKQHHKRFYDGLLFHRVIPGFMIQGGDPEGNGMGGPGYYFDDEIDPNLTFSVPGRLAMANSGSNTNGSQFYVTEVAVPELDGKYTIFGQCDAHSVEVVKAIAAVDRNSSDRPLTPVRIQHVMIVREGQPMPPDPNPPAAPTTAAAPSTAPAAH